MSQEAQSWRGSPNIELTAVHPQAMFGNVAVSLGAAATADIPPGEFGFPVSNDWMLGSMSHMGFVIIAGSTSGGLLEVYLSGDGATAVFSFVAAYTLVIGVNRLSDIPLAGWAARFRIVNSAGGLQAFTGIIHTKAHS
jgi:hypothetical protein